MNKLWLAGYFGSMLFLAGFFAWKTRAYFKKLKLQDYQNRLDQAVTWRSNELSRQRAAVGVRANGQGR